VSRALTRKAKQAKTRSSLLRSAAKLICRKGITEASVDEIATSAGYTKGAFYANFKTKEEMFLVMLDEAYAEELERLEAHLPGEGAPAEEVRASAEDFISFVRSDPEWPRLYFEFVVYAARNPEFRDELATRNRAMRERIAEIVRNWASDFPAQPPFPYEDLATMLFCMADGFLIQQLVEPDVDESLYATMNTTLFKGIAASALDLDLEALGGAQEAKSRKAGAGR
jgi:TetR/AcrR family transcriptional regulator, transcriptional repressor of aconitase